MVPSVSGLRDAGERRIRPGEAAVVRRIFADYAAGKSPRGLAHDLQAESLPGPGGRPCGDIDPALWDSARFHQKAGSHETSISGRELNRFHRPVYLLSGLLTCGVCGGGYTMVGKHRLGFATRRSKGTCDDAATIVRTDVERRVLDGLRARMLTPALMAEFVRVRRGERGVAQSGQQPLGAGHDPTG